MRRRCSLIYDSRFMTRATGQRVTENTRTIHTDLFLMLPYET